MEKYLHTLPYTAGHDEGGLVLAKFRVPQVTIKDFYELGSLRDQGHFAASSNDKPTMKAINSLFDGFASQPISASHEKAPHGLSRVLQ